MNHSTLSTSMEVIRSDKFVGDLEEADRLLKLEGIMCGDDLELYSHQVDIDYAVLNKNRNWIKNSKREQYYHTTIQVLHAENVI